MYSISKNKIFFSLLMYGTFLSASVSSNPQPDSPRANILAEAVEQCEAHTLLKPDNIQASKQAYALALKLHELAQKNPKTAQIILDNDAYYTKLLEDATAKEQADHAQFIVSFCRKLSEKIMNNLDWDIDPSWHYHDHRQPYILDEQHLIGFINHYKPTQGQDTLYKIQLATGTKKKENEELRKQIEDLRAKKKKADAAKAPK